MGSNCVVVVENRFIGHSGLLLNISGTGMLIMLYVHNIIKI